MGLLLVLGHLVLSVQADACAESVLGRWAAPPHCDTTSVLSPSVAAGRVQWTAARSLPSSLPFRRAPLTRPSERPWSCGPLSSLSPSHPTLCRPPPHPPPPPPPLHLAGVCWLWSVC